MQQLSGRAASMARRQAQVNGNTALPAKPPPRRGQVVAPVAVAMGTASAVAVPHSSNVSRPAVKAKYINVHSGREASRTRRQAMSAQGKAGVRNRDRQRVMNVRLKVGNQAQSNSDCGCGCHGQRDCQPEQVAVVPPKLDALSKAMASARRRQEPKAVTPSSAGRINSRLRRDAMAKHGKSGVDVFRKGLSSAQLVKHQNPDISGRDLARSVRALRATNGGQGAVQSAPVGRRRPARESNDVTGTKVSPSEKTTGDEVGLCRSVTGTEYFSSEVFSKYCQGDTAKSLPQPPPKVETTETFSGTKVTSGGKVGLSGKVTGDERGSCRSITGNEYMGREDFDDFCQSRPEPGSAKVSFSQTTRGQIISGSKPARSRSVTGDEAGTCKAVTGTPYAGMEQFEAYCEPSQVDMVAARNQRRSNNNAGREISGMQPGLVGLTGADKGHCQPVSGTAYLGTAEQTEVCGVAAAQLGESDFPQPLEGAPWGAFSVVAPAQASQEVPAVMPSVTGAYSEQGRISGTFAMGEGKVTGTEQFRSNGRASRVRLNPKEPEVVEAKISRITGEGIETGLNITGDDWDRGEHVTGTEGRSAARRNMTQRGPMSAMPSAAPKRNEEVPPSDTKITGGSGNSEKGAMVTLSGGARG